MVVRDRCVWQGDEVRTDADDVCLGPTERDEREAIDKGNIMKERTRHAKPTGTYQEPSDAKMGLR